MEAFEEQRRKASRQQQRGKFRSISKRSGRWGPSDTKKRIILNKVWRRLQDRRSDQYPDVSSALSPPEDSPSPFDSRNSFANEDESEAEEEEYNDSDNELDEEEENNYEDWRSGIKMYSQQ